MPTTRVYCAWEHRQNGGFPPGWRAVSFDATTWQFTIVRLWFWPFAAVWYHWAQASRRYLGEIPKGRYA